MPPQIQPIATDPSRMSASARWRHFAKQWRHCYVLLVAAFAVVWRVSALPIPELQDYRMGGLHPLDVLLLMDLLRFMWVLPLVAAVLYAASFMIPRLNTSAAIAVTALCSIPVLALTLVVALIHITPG
jgi:hypothetical protein